MSKIPLRIRQAVAERAAKRCEYCQLPVTGQVATFPVDHVVPESRSGPTALSNLALACPHCKTPVTLAKDGASLKCATCRRVYPIKDDIPVMLIDEATIDAD